MTSGITLNSTDGVDIKTDVELLHARLERLFFISIGDMPGNLDKGSRILDYFWEGATVENAQAILNEIKWLLRAYEPNVIPIKMGARFVDLDKGGTALIIELSLYFQDKESEEFDLRLTKIKD